MLDSLLRKIVKWLDPKLDRFRQPKKPTKPAKYTPNSLEDFIDVLRRTPKSILTAKDRNRIAAIMSFDTRTVGELMIEKSKMIFVDSKEVLGPLTLDKLYKSGFTNFPVINGKHEIKGIIHTEALNTLEIKETDRADKYLDTNVNYLNATDSLTQAVSEIERTNSYFFLVQDGNKSLAGFFTIQILLEYLLGE